MANPDAIFEGNGQAIDPVVQADGAVRMKAGGTTITVAGSADDSASQLTTDVTVLAGHGSVAVAAGPTSAPLRATPTPCFRVTVKAWVTNLGTLYVGLSTVTAGTNNSTGGFQLSPGESATFGVDDVGSVYIHGTAAEGASFFYET